MRAKCNKCIYCKMIDYKKIVKCDYLFETTNKDRKLKRPKYCPSYKKKTTEIVYGKQMCDL